MKQPDTRSDGLPTRRAVLHTTAATLPLLAGCTESKDDDGAGEDTNGEASDDSDQGTDGSDTSTAQDGQDSGDEQDGSGGLTEAPVGERVGDDSFAMVVENVEETTEIGTFQEADSGNVFVVVTAGVKNETGDEYINFNSFLQTRLKDAEDYTYDPELAVTGRPLEGGQLAPGEVSRGDIVFEVPEDADGLVLQFDLAAFDLFDFDRVHVDLGSKADTIATLEQDLRVDLHDVGETIAQSDMEVTLNETRTETELDDFTAADEGHQFDIVDISVTNETGEATPVSIALQMVTKDGAGWMYQVDIGAQSALDQPFEQGSKLGDGETRRGEIAYQVPEDVEPLYWVFEFDLLADGTKTFWQLR